MIHSKAVKLAAALAATMLIAAPAFADRYDGRRGGNQYERGYDGHRDSGYSKRGNWNRFGWRGHRHNHRWSAWRYWRPYWADRRHNHW